MADAAENASNNGQEEADQTNVSKGPSFEEIQRQ